MENETGWWMLPGKHKEESETAGEKP